MTYLEKLQNDRYGFFEELKQKIMSPETIEALKQDNASIIDPEIYKMFDVMWDSSEEFGDDIYLEFYDWSKSWADIGEEFNLQVVQMFHKSRKSR